MSVPEPTTELWLWLRTYWDENIWPPTDEAVVWQMGEAWQELGRALETSVAEAEQSVQGIPAVWRDVTGAVYTRNAGQTLTDLRSAIRAYQDMAELCFTFAREVANVRNAILSELALNAFFFAATLVMPAAAAAFWQARILAGMALRLTAVVRAAATAVARPVAAAIPQSVLRVAGAAGKGLFEATREAADEVAAGLVQDLLNNVQGYQDGINTDQMLINAIAGAGGPGLNKVLSPIGRLGALPANRLADGLRLGDRSAGRDFLNQAGHAFPTTVISSPILSVAATHLVDGTVPTWGEFGNAIVNQGPLAGALAVGRVGAVHAGGNLGQRASVGIQNLGGNPLPVRVPDPVPVGPADPTGPTPPAPARPPGSTGGDPGATDNNTPTSPAGNDAQGNQQPPGSNQQTPGNQAGGNQQSSGNEPSGTGGTDGDSSSGLEGLGRPPVGTSGTPGGHTNTVSPGDATHPNQINNQSDPTQEAPGNTQADPTAQTPTAGTPTTESPSADTPGTDAGTPTTETTAPQTPTADTPTTTTPGTDAPTTTTPGTDTPTTSTSGTDTPTTQTSAPQAPVAPTQTVSGPPTSSSPTTSPHTTSPTTQTPTSQTNPSTTTEAATPRPTRAQQTNPTETTDDTPTTDETPTAEVAPTIEATPTTDSSIPTSETATPAQLVQTGALAAAAPAVAAATPPTAPTPRPATPTHTSTSANNPTGTTGTDSPQGPIDPPTEPGGNSESNEFGWFDPASPKVSADAEAQAEQVVWTEETSHGRNLARWLVENSGRPRMVRARLAEVFRGQGRPRSDRNARHRAHLRGELTDSGGHALAWQFLHEVVRTNYFPQDRELNSGAFNNFENELADWVQQGNTVEYDVILPPGARPDWITVAYRVIDPAGRTIWTNARTFRNAPGEVFVPLKPSAIENFHPGTENVFEPPTDPPTTPTPPADPTPPTPGPADNAPTPTATDRPAPPQAQVPASAPAPAPNLARDAAVDGGPVRTADGERLSRVFDGNEVIRPRGPLQVGEQIIARLTRVLDDPAPRVRERLAELASRAGRPLYDGRVLGWRFFGNSGLSALMSDFPVTELDAYARLEDVLAEQIAAGAEVELTITRTPRPSQEVSPYSYTVEINSATGRSTYSARTLARLLDTLTDSAAAPTTQPTTETTTDANTVVTDEISHRVERFVPGWVLVSAHSGQLLADPSDLLTAAELQAIHPEGNGIYRITTSSGETFRLVKRVGPLQPGQQLEYSVQLHGVPTVDLLLSDRLTQDEIAPMLARVLAESAAIIRGDEDGTQVFQPDSAPQTQAVQRPADAGDRAELRQRGMLDERIPATEPVRRTAVQAEIRKLALAMGVVDEQPNAELLRSMLNQDERAVLDRIKDRGQALSDDRVSRGGYLVKAVIGSGWSTMVIGAAATVFTGDPLVGVGIAVPTLINAFTGALSERYLDAQKQVGKRPAYVGERTQRRFDYPGLRGLLDGPEAVRPPIEKLPMATAWRNYLIRYATPTLATAAVSGALTLVGIPALSTAMVIASSALAKSLAERLVDVKKLEFRLRRVDATERIRLSDPALYANQLATELVELQTRLDRVLTALDVRAGRSVGEPAALPAPGVTQVNPKIPGAPPFKITLAVQFIDNVSSAARRVFVGGSQTVDVDPTELAKHVSAQVEGLLNAVGPGLVGSVTGAMGDKYFINREEAANDARKVWARAEQEAVQIAALAETVEPRLREFRRLAGQLEQLVGAPSDLADLADERGLPVPTAAPAGARPSGQSSWTAYTIQVAAASLGGALSAVGLDLVFDLPDLGVVLTVAGASGAIIGTPIARYLFRRTEIGISTQLEPVLASQALNRSDLLEQQALSRYLVGQLSTRAQQITERITRGTAAATATVEPLETDRNYTDYIRAAVRRAELDSVPTQRAESVFDEVARTRRVETLQRIDQLAAEVDRLQALGFTDDQLAEARRKVQFEIQMFEAIADGNRSTQSFPELGTVDVATGRRVVGLTDQIRAGVEQAIRRLIAEPAGKPLLAERLIALEKLAQAAEAVDHHAVHGTDDSRALVRTQYEEALENANLLWRSSGVPNGLVLPVLSVSPGLDRPGGRVTIPLQSAPPAVPVVDAPGGRHHRSDSAGEGVLEWNHTRVNGAQSLFEDGTVADPDALNALERGLASLVERGYQVEVTIDRTARPSTLADPHRFTVRVTDPTLTGPLATETHGPATAADLITDLALDTPPGRHRVDEATGRHHAEEATGRHHADESSGRHHAEYEGRHRVEEPTAEQTTAEQPASAAQPIAAEPTAEQATEAETTPPADPRTDPTQTTDESPLDPAALRRTAERLAEQAQRLAAAPATTTTTAPATTTTPATTSDPATTPNPTTTPATDSPQASSGERGRTVHAPEVRDTRFVRDGRPTDTPQLSAREAVQAAVAADEADFGGLINGRPDFVADDIVVVQTDQRGPQYFRYVDGSVPQGRVASTTVRDGSITRPHLVRIASSLAGDQLTRAWVHEISHTLQEQAAPRSRLRRILRRPSARTEDACVAAQLNEYRLLTRQLRAAQSAVQAGTGTAETVQALENDLRGLTAAIEARGHQAPQLENTAPIEQSTHDPVDEFVATVESQLNDTQRQLQELQRRIDAKEAKAAEAAQAAQQAEQTAAKAAQDQDSGRSSRVHQAQQDAAKQAEVKQWHDQVAAAYQAAYDQLQQAAQGYETLLADARSMDPQQRAAHAAGLLTELTTYEQRLADIAPPLIALSSLLPTNWLPHLSTLTERVNAVLIANGVDHRFTVGELQHRLNAEFGQLVTSDGATLQIGRAHPIELRLRLSVTELIELMDPSVQASETMLGVLPQPSRKLGISQNGHVGTSAAFALNTLTKLFGEQSWINAVGELVTVKGSQSSGRGRSVTSNGAQYGQDGAVEDNRGESLLYSARASWHLQARHLGEPDHLLADVRVDSSTAKDVSRLRAWASHAYTTLAPTRTTTNGTQPAGRLPNHTLTSLDGLQSLTDKVFAKFSDQLAKFGDDASLLREQIHSAINHDLPSRLAESTEGSILRPLQANGRPVGHLQVKTTVRYEQTELVGQPSTAHWQERVRVGFSTANGQQNFSASTSLTAALGYGGDVLTDLGDTTVDVGPSVSAGRSLNRSESSSGGGVGIHVGVQRYTGPTQAYRLVFEHEVTVVLDGQSQGNVTGDTVGLTRLQTNEAYRHGLPVAESAFIHDQQGNRVLTDGEPVLRGDPRTGVPVPGRSLQLPTWLANATGRLTGAGPGLAQQVTGGQQALAALTDPLVERGFLPPLDSNGDPDLSKLSTDPLERHSQLLNLTELRTQLSVNRLEAGYDIAVQDGIVVTLTRAATGRAAETLSLRVSIRPGQPSAVGVTTDEAMVTLNIGSDTTGRTNGWSKSLPWNASPLGLTAGETGTGIVKGGLSYGRQSLGRVMGWFTGGTVNQVTLVESRSPVAAFEVPHRLEVVELNSTAEEPIQYFGTPGTSARILLDTDLLPSTEVTPNQLVADTVSDQVLDRATLVALDTHELRQLAAELAGQDPTARHHLAAFLDPRHLLAHPEWARTTYRTDAVLRGAGPISVRGSLAIAGRIGAVTLLGMTDAVAGDINLALSSHGLSAGQSTGGSTSVNVGGTMDAQGGTASGEYGTSSSTSRTDMTIAGVERLTIEVGRHYLLQGVAGLTVTADGTPVTADAPVVLQVAERDALQFHLDGELTLPLEQVADVVERYLNGNLELDRRLAGGVIRHYRAALAAAAVENQPVPALSAGHTARVLLEKLQPQAGRPTPRSKAAQLELVLAEATALDSTRTIRIPEHLQNNLGSSLVEQARVTDQGRDVALLDRVRELMTEQLGLSPEQDPMLAEALSVDLAGKRWWGRLEDMLGPDGFSRTYPFAQPGRLGAQEVTLRIRAEFVDEAVSLGTTKSTVSIVQRYLYGERSGSASTGRSVGAGLDGGWQEGRSGTVGTDRSGSTAVSVGEQTTRLERLATFDGQHRVRRALKFTIELMPEATGVPARSRTGRALTRADSPLTPIAPVTLTGDLVQLIPLRVLPEVQPTPVTTQPTPTASSGSLNSRGLPDAYFVEGAVSNDLRDAILERLAQPDLLGPAGARMHAAELAGILSTVTLNASFSRMAHDDGFAILRLPLPGYTSRTVEVRVVATVVGTRLVSGPVDGVEIGEVNRSQHTVSHTTTSGRLLPIDGGTSAENSDLGTTGGVSAGDQLADQTSDGRGVRRERSRFEKGRAVTVEVEVRYDVDLVRQQLARDGEIRSGDPVQLQQAPRGTAYLTMFESDYHQLEQFLTSQPTSTEGDTVHAPEVDGTRFVADGRPADAPRATTAELVEAALAAEESDFGGVIEGQPDQIGSDLIQVRSRQHGEQIFRAAPGPVRAGRVAATTIRGGTAQDPHLVRFAPGLAGDQLTRAWVHEITHALEENSAPRSRLRQLLSRARSQQNPNAEDACVTAQQNEFRLLSRQWSEAADAVLAGRSEAVEAEQALRQDLAGLAEAIEARGHQPPAMPWTSGLSAVEQLQLDVADLTGKRDAMHRTIDDLRARVAAKERDAQLAEQRLSQAEEAVTKAAASADTGRYFREHSARKEIIKQTETIERQHQRAAAYRNALRQAEIVAQGYDHLLLDAPTRTAVERAAAVAGLATRLTAYEQSQAALAPSPMARSSLLPTDRLPHLSALTDRVNAVLAANGVDHRFTVGALQQRLTAEFAQVLTTDGTTIQVGDAHPIELRFQLSLSELTELLDPSARTTETSITQLSQGSRRLGLTQNGSAGTSGAFALQQLTKLFADSSWIAQAGQLLSAKLQYGSTQGRSRTTTGAQYGLEGGIENNRGESALIVAAASWRVTARPLGEPTARLADVRVSAGHKGDAARLHAWSSHVYLTDAPTDTVERGTPPSGRLPNHVLTSLDGLQSLTDKVSSAFAEQLSKFGDQSALLHEQIRSAIHHDLPARLPESTEQSILQPLQVAGRPVGHLQIKSTVRYERTELVGGSSSSHWQERLRFGFSNATSQQNFTTSTSLATTLGYGGDALSNLGEEQLDLGPTASAGRSRSRTESLAGGGSAVHIGIQRYIGPTQGYRLVLDHQVTLALTGQSPAVVTGETEALLRLRTTDAYRHGLPIAKSALVLDDNGNPLIENGEPVLRGDPREGRQVPGRELKLPTWLETPSGELNAAGPTQVQYVTGGEQALAELAEPLAKRGFLPALDVNGDVDLTRLTSDPVAAQAQLLNLTELRAQLSVGRLEAGYDIAVQSGILVTLTKAATDGPTESLTLRIAIHPDAPSSVAVSTDEAMEVLNIGSQNAVRSGSWSKSLPWTASPLGLGQDTPGRPAIRSGLSYGRQSLGRTLGWITGGTVNRAGLIETLSPLAVFEVPHRLEVVELDAAPGEGIRHLGSPGTSARVLVDTDLLPSTELAPTQVSAGPVAHKVLDRAVMIGVRTNGLPALAAEVTGQDPAARHHLAALLDPRHLLAHPEWAQTTYRTDVVIQSARVASTRGSLAISGQLSDLVLLGLTDEVTLEINLALNSHGLSAGRSTGSSAAMNFGVGDQATGSMAAQHGTTSAMVRTRQTTTGIERMVIEVGRHYLFSAKTELSVAAGSSAPQVVDGVTTFEIPERDVLRFHVDGDLTLPPAQLADVVERYLQGHLELDRRLAAALIRDYRRMLSVAAAANEPLPALSRNHGPREVLAKFTPERPTPRSKAAQLDLVLAEAADLAGTVAVDLPAQYRENLGSSVVEAATVAESGTEVTFFDTVRSLLTAQDAGPESDPMLTEALFADLAGPRWVGRLDEMLGPDGFTRAYPISRAGRLGSEQVQVRIRAAFTGQPTSLGVTNDAISRVQRYLYDDQSRTASAGRSAGTEVGGGIQEGRTENLGTDRTGSSSVTSASQLLRIERMATGEGLHRVARDLQFVVEVTGRPTVALTGKIVQLIPARTMAPALPVPASTSPEASTGSGSGAAPQTTDAPIRSLNERGVPPIFFTEGAEGNELREAVLTRLAEPDLLGPAGSRAHRTELESLLSPVTLAASFSRMAQDDGFTLLPLPRPGYSAQTVEVRIGATVLGAKLIGVPGDHVELGEQDRSQQGVTHTITAGRLLPVDGASQVSEADLGLSGGITVGDQLADQTVDTRGLRREWTRFEESRAVTVRVEVQYDVELVRQRLLRTGEVSDSFAVELAPQGVAYLTMFESDYRQLEQILDPDGRRTDVAVVASPPPSQPPAPTAPGWMSVDPWVRLLGAPTNVAIPPHDDDDCDDDDEKCETGGQDDGTAGGADQR
ncbi:hypothetical protein AB0P21_37035 [Kribbella sp. NPDC056861]|uniref:WXG100-like domain-containing protein n=1 Tax=Kribbella sp. NPDC056861 TaxID=3154857 RepID=UPI003437EF5F